MRKGIFEMSEKVKMITIKQGTFELSVPRSELVEVQETADGVVFKFKGGLVLEKIDQYMPQHTKQIMQATADSFPEASLVYDLTNQSKPVMAMMD